MDRLIRKITDQLVSRLPDNENFYRIQNLDEYGFPPFLIRRIHIELQWNLDESMVLPKTDWANTQSEAVQQSWQRFLNAIHAEVQLPASYARAVIEAAVADVVEILVQPRKSIPEILFGGEDMLSAEQLKERAELLVVYPHFANVLTAYLERKSKDELDREHCKRIIIQVDEKITYQYTPLQWAQMLDPLFTLGGKSIDTNIFRLFFEDKKRPRVARKFDLMNDSISQVKFIEVLSSPEMLDYEGDEPDQSELFSGKQPEETQENIEKEKDFSEETGSANTESDEETDQQATNNQPVEEHTEEKRGSDFSENSVQVGEEEQDQDEIQVEEKPVKKEKANGNITEKTQKTEEEMRYERKKEFEKRIASLNQTFLDSGEDDEDEKMDSEEDQPETDTPPKEEKVTEELEGENEGTAIWKKFLNSEEEQNEEEYDNEPIIGLTDNDEVTEEKEKLEKLLESERSYYVQELFGGSEQAYEESLREIARQDDWKSASRQIEKNIFKRNMINIYSEPAVDFTDRLQTYFLDKQNSNK